MGLFRSLTKQCFFCGSRKNVKYIRGFGIYAPSLGDWYHDSCLEVICSDPESHKQYVDLAVDIFDRIDTVKKGNEEKCEQLRQRCKREG